MTSAPSGLIIRRARREDVPAIMAMHAADEMASHGVSADASALIGGERAFDRISESASDELYVAELDGVVVGTFQTTLTTVMTRHGRPDLTISAVQTRSDMRGRGVGAAMVEFAIQRAREAGASRVQLTSNLARADARRFYARLGFAHSHAGFKLALD